MARGQKMESLASRLRNVVDDIEEHIETLAEAEQGNIRIDFDCMQKAIDEAQRGRVGECLHHLSMAVPGLEPLADVKV